jgi:hypothetical protein
MKNVTMFPCLRFFIFAHSDRDLARLGLYHLLSRDIHEVATLEGQVAYADWKEYNKGTYDISQMVNDCITKSVVHHGTQREPFPEDEFEAQVRSRLGMTDTERAPGFCRYEEDFRQSLVGRMFHADEGDILDTEVFEYYVPCTLAHPELCAQLHSDCLPDIKKCAKSLRRVLKGALIGSFHCLRFVGPTGEEACFFALSYSRGGNPIVEVLSPCAFDVATELVTICDVEASPLPLHQFAMDVTFLGRVMVGWFLMDAFVVISLTRFT